MSSDTEEPQRNAVIGAFAARVSLVLMISLSSCSNLTDQRRTNHLSIDEITPRISKSPDILRLTGPRERAHLQLIATSFVSILMQINQMQPSATTVQISTPATAFGHALIRALEDAGYGLQLVDADQGRHYLTYRKRSSETESGPVTDYQIGIGDIVLSRDFIVQNDAVYPSSLLRIQGVKRLGNLELPDFIFLQQAIHQTAQQATFISGIRAVEHPDIQVPVRTLTSDSHHAVSEHKRTTPEAVFHAARLHFIANKTRRALPDLSNMRRASRHILMFTDAGVSGLGTDNRRSIRLLVADWSPGDLIIIRTCQGLNASYPELALQRAGRVSDELYRLGVAEPDIYIAPCIVNGFYQQTNEQPAVVELLHYREMPG